MGQYNPTMEEDASVGEGMYEKGYTYWLTSIRNIKVLLNFIPIESICGWGVRLDTLIECVEVENVGWLRWTVIYSILWVWGNIFFNLFVGSLLLLSSLCSSHMADFCMGFKFWFQNLNLFCFFLWCSRVMFFRVTEEFYCLIYYTKFR